MPHVRICGGVGGDSDPYSVPGALAQARARMRGMSFALELNLHLGTGAARMLASDLSPAYVRFNAEYTT